MAFGLPHVEQGGGLGFHDNQGDAVDEQHQVGDDHALVVLRAAPLVAAADAELVGDDELVEAAIRVVEVEEADGAGADGPRAGRRSGACRR